MKDSGTAKPLDRPQMKTKSGKINVKNLNKVFGSKIKQKKGGGCCGT